MMKLIYLLGVVHGQIFRNITTTTTTVGANAAALPTGGAAIVNGITVSVNFKGTAVINGVPVQTATFPIVSPVITNLVYNVPQTITYYCGNVPYTATQTAPITIPYSTAVTLAQYTAGVQVVGGNIIPNNPPNFVFNGYAFVQVDINTNVNVQVNSGSGGGQVAPGQGIGTGQGPSTSSGGAGLGPGQASTTSGFGNSTMTRTLSGTAPISGGTAPTSSVTASASSGTAPTSSSTTGGAGVGPGQTSRGSTLSSSSSSTLSALTSSSSSSAVQSSALLTTTTSLTSSTSQSSTSPTTSTSSTSILIISSSTSASATISGQPTSTSLVDSSSVITSSTTLVASSSQITSAPSSSGITSSSVIISSSTSSAPPAIDTTCALANLAAAGNPQYAIYAASPGRYSFHDGYLTQRLTDDLLYGTTSDINSAVFVTIDSIIAASGSSCRFSLLSGATRYPLSQYPYIGGIIGRNKPDDSMITDGQRRYAYVGGTLLQNGTPDQSDETANTYYIYSGLPRTSESGIWQLKGGSIVLPDGNTGIPLSSLWLNPNNFQPPTFSDTVIAFDYENSDYNFAPSLASYTKMVSGGYTYSATLATFYLVQMPVM